MDISAELFVRTEWYGILILTLANALKDRIHTMKPVFNVDQWLEILYVPNVDALILKLISTVTNAFFVIKDVLLTLLMVIVNAPHTQNGMVLVVLRVYAI